MMRGLAEEVLEVAAEPLGPDGGVGDHDEHERGQGVGEVDVAARGRAVVRVVEQAREDLQPVAHQDEEEERHRQRDRRCGNRGPRLSSTWSLR